MDATTLRLILIVIGVILILALYLWERHREQQELDDEEEFYEDEDEGRVRTIRREPSFDPDLSDLQEDEPRSSGQGARRRRAVPPETRPEPEPEQGERAQPKSSRERSSAEPLLIQMSISARRYPFRGPDIMEAAASCGLYPGEMDIFHCFDEFDDETRIYFSMANMVKPGTFPFDDMESFTTPGLVLFAQLEGNPEDLTIFDEMLATARKLALTLNGDVLDENRKPLTVKKEEELRQAVLENEQRWLRIRRR